MKFPIRGIAAKAISSQQKVDLFLQTFRGRTDVFAEARLEPGPKPTYHPAPASWPTTSSPI